MHITSERLSESLTQVELLHIKSCTQCKIERQKLIALKLSANQISLVVPPVAAWENIQNKLPVPTPQSNPLMRFVYASAASVFMMAVGWLMWSNYTLQQQMEEILLVNMILEDKINIEQKVTFQQASLVELLQELDSELYQATTTKEKLAILQKRRQLIQQHLASKIEDEHEFSI